MPLQKIRPGQAEDEHRGLTAARGKPFQQFQQALLRPMQVLEHQDQRSTPGPGVQKATQRMQHHFTAVTRLAADAGIPDRHGTAVDQGFEPGQPGFPQRVVVARDLGAHDRGQIVRQHLALVGSQHRCTDPQDAVVQLLPGDGEGIAIFDVALLFQHLCQRPVRQSFAVGGTAAAQNVRRRVTAFQVLQELLDQPGLADPGRSHHGHQVRMVPFHHAAIQRGQKLHLLVATDHLRLEPPRRRFVGEAGDAEPRPPAKLLALQRWQRFVGNGMPRSLARPIVHHDPVWRGLGLQPRGEVYHLTGHHELTGRRRQQVGDDFPGGDGDAQVQIGVQFCIEAGHPPLHCQRRPQRPFRVILVRRRHPEDGHHRIPDEFLHRPSVPGDLFAHRRKEAGDQRAHRLRVQLPGHAGGTCEVGKQHGDHAPFGRAGALQRCAALQTKLRP